MGNHKIFISRFEQQVEKGYRVSSTGNSNKESLFLGNESELHLHL